MRASEDQRACRPKLIKRLLMVTMLITARDSETQQTYKTTIELPKRNGGSSSSSLPLRLGIWYRRMGQKKLE